MSFKDIKGQSDVVNILRKSIQKDRIYQSLLFYGNSGVGKYLTAINFAKAINCYKLKAESCDNCISCTKVSNYNHPDVLIINQDGKNSTIKIDDIRKLQSSINLKCFESDKKICIIRDAEKMTAEAENSLLKSLEEVPSRTVIILIVSNLQNIFSTVISRCQVIRFKPLSHEIMKQIVIEQTNISTKELDFIISISEGSLERVFNYFNRSVLKQRNKLVNLMSKKNKELLFYIPEYNTREDIITFLDIMISWYKDIFLLKAGTDKLIINKDKIELLYKRSKDIALDKLETIIDTIMDTRRNIINNANIKLAIHNNMIKICELEGVI